MAKTMRWYFLNDAGRLIDEPTLSSAQQPFLAPTLRGLAYGDGFFTTIGVYDGQVLWQSYHQARLQSHLNALYLSLSANQQQNLWCILNKFAADIKHGIIKVIISRSAQPLRGYAHSTNLTDNACLLWIGVKATDPLATQSAEFLTPKQSASIDPAQNIILQQPSVVATCLDSQLSSLPPPLVGLKSLNRLDSVLAAGELERRKQSLPALAEGLVQDLNGNWVEGVMSNVFYQLTTSSPVKPSKPEKLSKPAKLEKQWYTPPIETSGVKGVMRQVVIDRLQALKTPVQQRHLTDADLDNIESMFFCNAVRGIIPVYELKTV